MPTAEDGKRVSSSFYAHTSGPMTQAAVRRYADAQTARIQSAAGNSKQIIATVFGVFPGEAKDGNARVIVLWRGQICSVNGYVASYTPVRDHRVLCSYIDGQLIILGRIIGQP